MSLQSRRAHAPATLVCAHPTWALRCRPSYRFEAPDGSRSTAPVERSEPSGSAVPWPRRGPTDLRDVGHGDTSGTRLRSMVTARAVDKAVADRATVDLLGVLAYGELSAFDRLA